jgi:hypothetical protein
LRGIVCFRWVLFVDDLECVVCPGWGVRRGCVCEGSSVCDVIWSGMLARLVEGSRRRASGNLLAIMVPAFNAPGFPLRSIRVTVLPDRLSQFSVMGWPAVTVGNPPAGISKELGRF